MSAPVLLVTITLGGRILRVATERVDIDDAASGLVLAYADGVDTLAVDLALSFLASSGPQSVPVQCVLPVDLALEDSLGRRFAGSPAEVAIWSDGDDYAERTVLAVGTVSNPEWGEDGEPVSFAIASPEHLDAIEVPAATEQVDGTTWPDTVLSLAEDDLGVPYPLVFGSPGRIDDSSWVTGSQGVWVDHQRVAAGGGNYSRLQLVIAGHRVTGSTVLLNTDAATPGVEFRVYHQLDARGVEVAFVDAYYDWPTNTTFSSGGVSGLGAAALHSSYQPDANASAPVFVGWLDNAGLSPLAGDVIAYMLGRAAAPVDLGRFASAAALLRPYRFDCVVDARTKALAWLRANVYPMLPVSLEEGPEGQYPVVWRYDATAQDATLHLDADADPMISRAGATKEDSSQIANAFSAQYRYSVRTDSYTETLIRDAATCPYCAASERRWGRIERSTGTRVVYDSASVASSLSWMARAYTQPQRRIPYLVPSSYGLTRGQIVLLTDSLISYSRRVCLVSRVQPDGTGIDGAELLFIADLPRDRV